MAELKTGARLKSAVCDGEVMIVIAPAGDLELTCGGAPMVAAGVAVEKGQLNADHAVGIRIGKRYVNEDGTLEVLCVKNGDGGVGVNGVLLLQKDTKKLPKTD